VLLDLSEVIRMNLSLAVPIAFREGQKIEITRKYAVLSDQKHKVITLERELLMNSV